MTDRPGHDRRYAIDCAKIRARAGLAPASRSRTGLARDRRLVPGQPAPGSSASAAAPTATTTTGSTAGRLAEREADDEQASAHELRGVVLAGGKGTRLGPLTKVTNKHLLPVGPEPMVFHPLKKLVEAGIREILLVSGTEHMGDFVGCSAPAASSAAS